MASVHKKGRVYWAAVRDLSFERKWIPTHTASKDEAQAFADEYQLIIDAKRAARGRLSSKHAPNITVDELWLLFEPHMDELIDGIPRVRDQTNYRSLYQSHYQLNWGQRPVSDVGPKDIRVLVRNLRASSRAPKTTINIFYFGVSLFNFAVSERIIELSPFDEIDRKKELPKLRDKNAEWRADAVYEMRELLRLIFNPTCPPERSIAYAIEVFGGVRVGEAANVLVRDYQRDHRPLARLVITKADHGPTKEVATKVVPVHPLLKMLLDRWLEKDWPLLMGRKDASLILWEMLRGRNPRLRWIDFIDHAVFAINPSSTSCATCL